MANVGSAYVQLMPSMRGFAAQIDSQFGSAGTSAGSAFGGKASKGILSVGTVAGVASSVASKAFSAMAQNMGSAIARVDTLNNFPRVMQNLGYSSEEAEASIKKLSDGINGLPTSLDGIVSMTQQLAPLCGGLTEATDLSLALNNMFLAGGASTADMERAMVQYTQALSKGKFELNDWRSIQEVIPGQLNQMAEAMLGAGKNSTDLYEALKDGTVSMEDFNDTVLKLNEEGTGNFASFAEQAATSTGGIGTAMENVQNRISKALASIIDAIGQTNISGAINAFSSKFSLISDAVVDVIELVKANMDRLSPIADGAASAFDSVKSAVDDVAGKVGAALAPKIEEASQKIEPLAEAFGRFVDKCGEVAGAIIESMGPAFEDLAEWLGGKLSSGMDALTGLFDALTGALDAMRPVLEQIGPLLPTVAAGFVGVKKGMEWGDKASDALKWITELKGSAGLQGLKGALEDGVAAFQLFRDGASISDVFSLLTGGVGGITGAFKNLATAIGPAGIIGIIAGVVGALMTLYATNEDFRNFVDGFVQELVTFFTQTIPAAWDTLVGICSGVMDSIKGFFSDAADGIQGAWEGVCDFFSGIGDAIMGAWEGVVSFVTEDIPAAFQSLIDFITVDVPAGFQQFIADVGAFMAELPYNIGYWLSYTLVSVGLWVLDMGAKALECGAQFLQNVGTFFMELPGKVAEFLTTTATNVAAWVLDMAAKAIEAGSQFLNNVVSFVTQLPGRIAAFLSSVISNVVGWVSQMASNALQAGQQFLNNVVSFVTQLPGKVASFLSQAVSKAASFVSNFASKALQAGQQFLSNIVSELSRIPQRVFSIGADIVRGVWNGIQSMVGWFTSQVGSFFSGIVDGAKAALGIASPSKVMAREVGKWVPAGVAEGIEGNLAPLTKAMDDVYSEVERGAAGIKGFSGEYTVNGAAGTPIDALPLAPGAAKGSSTTYTVYIDAKQVDDDLAIQNAIDVLVDAAGRSGRSRG